jgi:hypothetical protein
LQKNEINRENTSMLSLGISFSLLSRYYGVLVEPKELQRALPNSTLFPMQFKWDSQTSYTYERVCSFRGRADVPGYIRRNEYQKRIFLTLRTRFFGGF